MTLAAALLIYAILTALVVPPLLGRATWLAKSPKLGVLAWQAVLAAVFSALVLLMVVAALPTEALSFDLTHAVHACAVQFSELYQRGELGHGRVLAAVLGTATAGRLCWVLVSQVRVLRRQRGEHRVLLDLLAGDPEADGALLLPAGVPAAYCVPGGKGRIVLTTGAAASLGDAQRRAVIAHERAHLRGRHHLVLLSASVAVASLPWLPFLRQAQRRIAAYIEMVADDAAARISGPGTVLSALVGLVRIDTAGSLPASGTATFERIQRLLEPDTASVKRGRRCLVATGAASMAIFPSVLVAAPLLAAYAGLCLPVVGA